MNVAPSFADKCRAQVALVRRECIRIAGGEVLGETAYGNEHLIIFSDPRTGSTLAMRAADVTSVAAVSEKLAESRAKFGVL